MTPLGAFKRARSVCYHSRLVNHDLCILNYESFVKASSTGRIYFFSIIIHIVSPLVLVGYFADYPPQNGSNFQRKYFSSDCKVIVKLIMQGFYSSWDDMDYFIESRTAASSPFPAKQDTGPQHSSPVPQSSQR
jgi:hypothetical protein